MPIQINLKNSINFIQGWYFVLAKAAYDEREYTELGKIKIRRYFHTLFYRVEKSGKTCRKWIRFPMSTKSEYFDKFYLALQDPKSAMTLKQTLANNKGCKISDVADMLIENINNGELNFLIDWEKYSKSPLIKSITESPYAPGDPRFVSKPKDIDWPDQAKKLHPLTFGQPEEKEDVHEDKGIPKAKVEVTHEADQAKIARIKAEPRTIENAEHLEAEDAGDCGFDEEVREVAEEEEMFPAIEPPSTPELEEENEPDSLADIDSFLLPPDSEYMKQWNLAHDEDDENNKDDENDESYEDE